MTETEKNSNSPLLTFEGKKYEVNNLSNDTKELIKGLQIAETQLKMYEDTLKLIAVGKNKMVEDLKKILDNVEPIKNV